MYICTCTCCKHARAHVHTYHQKTFPVAVTAVVMKLETESCVIVSCSRSGKTCAEWVRDWTREGAASSTDTEQTIHTCTCTN